MISDLEVLRTLLEYHPEDGTFTYKVRGKGMWRANITINYRSIHLGYFLTKEQAYAAYLAASQETFGEYAHHKSRS